MRDVSCVKERLFEAVRVSNEKEFLKLYKINTHKCLNDAIIEYSLEWRSADILISLYLLGQRASPHKFRDYLIEIDKRPFHEKIFKSLLLLFEGVFEDVDAQILFTAKTMKIQREGIYLYLFNKGVGSHVLETDYVFFQGDNPIARSYTDIRLSLFYDVLKVACLNNSIDLLKSYEKLHGNSESGFSIECCLNYAVDYDSFILFKYFVDNKIYNKASISTAVKKLARSYGDYTIEMIDMLIPLTKARGFLYDVKEFQLKREFGAPKMALKFLKKDRSVWLKPLLRRYFLKSKRSPLDYLKECPDWHKQKVMDLILNSF